MRYTSREARECSPENREGYIFIIKKKEVRGEKRQVKGSESKVKWLSCVRLLATPWTVAYHASPSMGFSRQELEWVAIIKV